MSLTLQEIIDEADILVPNTSALADKVAKLNSINDDFFNVVKIPQIERFNAIANQADYALDVSIRQKNIDLVEMGLLKYVDLMSENVNPTQNNYSFKDSNNTLTLSPAPYKNGLPGIVRYHRIATTTFVTSTLSAEPDAPSEYHWTYVSALASYLALTQEDLTKSNILENSYKTGWNVAAQNYQRK